MLVKGAKGVIRGTRDNHMPTVKQQWNIYLQLTPRQQNTQQQQNVNRVCIPRDIDTSLDVFILLENQFGYMSYILVFSFSLFRYHWFQFTALEYDLHGGLHISVALILQITVDNYFLLIHWGRVTCICVSKLTIIGSDNALTHGRRQTVFWTNAGMLKSESKFIHFFQENAFENVARKSVAIFHSPSALIYCLQVQM